MKNLIFSSPKLVTIGALWLPIALGCAAIRAQAQAPTVQAGVSVTPAPVITTDAPAVSATATAKLPYGVDDVLKLCRGKVSDDIIVTYVQNSGTAYNLSPQVIVYLREQGVSDRIVSVMLEQRRRVVEA